MNKLFSFAQILDVLVDIFILSVASYYIIIGDFFIACICFGMSGLYSISMMMGLNRLDNFKYEVCICSAILLKDGRIMRGERHCDCYALMQRKGITDRSEADQGFITSKNRFVNRAEGLKLQMCAGIKSADPEGYRWQLYSEDLY